MVNKDVHLFLFKQLTGVLPKETHAQPPASDCTPDPVTDRHYYYYYYYYDNHNVVVVVVIIIIIIVIIIIIIIKYTRKFDVTIFTSQSNVMIILKILKVNSPTQLLETFSGPTSRET